MDLKEVSERSAAIRAAYHALEREYHGSEWSIEEDALAFLTDASLAGRLTMSHEGRWPSDSEDKLPAKIGECVWWLSVLADRMGLDFSDCVTKFLEDTEQALK
ncbi:MAG: MazG-like protein [Megasphaera elsdenii]|uniref:MazG-like protein n=1 Tax=Megasphaera elsdenii TaxID=907 RepID=UPI003F0B1049